jgi:hypothetical protein
MSTELLVRFSPGNSRLKANTRCDPEKPDRKRQPWATCLTKTGAETVLDWLEAHGHSDCRVSYVAGEGFTVSE